MSYVRKVYSILTPAERMRAARLLGLMVIGMGLEMLGTGLVIPAIVVMTEHDLGTTYPSLAPLLRALGNPTQTQIVVGGMLVLVVVNVIRAVFLAFLLWRQNEFAFGLQASLSQRLFETYLRQPYTFMLQRNSAQLIRNTTGEVNQFTGVVILSVMVILSEGLVLLGLAGLLMVVEPLGAAVVVLVTGIAAWAFTRVTRGPLGRWGLVRQHHEGLRIQHLQQGLGGAKEVKLLGREDHFLARYQEHSVQTARVAQLQNTLNGLPRLWLELLAVLGMAMLVLTVVAQGRDMARIVSTLGLFAAAAFRLMPTVNRTLSAVQSLRFGLPTLDLLHAELHLPVPEMPARRPTAPTFQTAIELAGVSYRYPGAETPALTGVSLVIRKGESVGLVGPSGSGKSTLVDVILGLLTPVAGQVLVDGQDIHHNLRAWQREIGYVPQSIYLTDDTLRRNVAFGLPLDAIDAAAVERAIRAAQLEEFVASLPDGLETTVGERGVRLSGGQRQRIGVARALYHDPPLLVLDEATSALDTVTEREVMEAVAALHGSKSILIVAHRLSTVEQCGRLYQLEQGSLVAEGQPTAMFRMPRVGSTHPR